MSRWVDVPIVGGSYADSTRDWSFQDTVNWLPMRAEKPGGRSVAMLRDVPGLRIVANVGNGPYRGLRDVEGKLFVVSGNKLYQVNTDFTATEIGTVPGVGLVSMAHNQVGLDGGNELVIGTVDSGYVYNTKTGSFTQITDPGFPGIQSADFIGGYIIGIEPQRRYWFHSELADARNYNTTDIYSAESSPDRLSRVIVANSEVVAIGERSTDFFDNFVSGNAAFQNKRGTSNDKGTVSPYTVQLLDNTLFMLGSDGIVYRLDGYRWVRVSHHPLEQAIAGSDLSRAFAYTYEDRGHAIYYLSFPDGKTWGYDVSQGEWARRESYGFDRWRVNGLVRWNGAWYAGDFADGSLYEVDWDYPGKEGCDEIVRKRVAGVLHDDFNRVAVNAVRIRASSGLLASVYPEPAIAGDLPNGTVGDVVSYQYAITLPYPGQPYTLSIANGSLPGGLSMDQDGLVTGTLVDAGTHAWDVVLSTACGDVSVSDTATVSAVDFTVTTLFYDELLDTQVKGRVCLDETTVGVMASAQAALVSPTGTYNERFFTPELVLARTDAYVVQSGSPDDNRLAALACDGTSRTLGHDVNFGHLEYWDGGVYLGQVAAADCGLGGSNGLFGMNTVRAGWLHNGRAFVFYDRGGFELKTLSYWDWLATGPSPRVIDLSAFFIEDAYLNHCVDNLGNAYVLNVSTKLMRKYDRDLNLLWERSVPLAAFAGTYAAIGARNGRFFIVCRGNSSGAFFLSSTQDDMTGTSSFTATPVNAVQGSQNTRMVVTNTRVYVQVDNDIYVAG